MKEREFVINPLLEIAKNDEDLRIILNKVFTKE